MSELTPEIVQNAIDELFGQRIPTLAEVPPDALSAEILLELPAGYLRLA